MKTSLLSAVAPHVLLLSASAHGQLSGPRPLGLALNVARSMKITIAFLVLAAVQVALGAEKLALEVYRLVPASQSRPEEARLVLKVVNLSDAPLYFDSLSPTAPLSRIERKKEGAWVADPGSCARDGRLPRGWRPQVILPRTYLVFDELDVFFPPPGKGDEAASIKLTPKLPAEPVRIIVTCYEDTAGERPVVAATREFAPAEFVQK